MPRIERTDGPRRAFWQIDLEGPLVTVRHGPLGADGAVATHRFDDATEARRAYERLLAELGADAADRAPRAADAARRGASAERLTVQLTGRGTSVELSAQGDRVTERRWSTAGDEVEISARAFDDATHALDELGARTTVLVRDGFEETERRRERVGPPGAAPAPDGREASEPEHERACLAAAPDDAGPWQVYADWLQGRGDPRGTLAALFLSGQGAAGTSFLERWREALLGPAAQLVPLEAGALVFRHGFLTQARLWRRRGSATDLSALTRAFLAQPFTRFVTALRFGLASDEADNDWGPTLAALVESPRAAQLSALAFDDFGPDEADLASTPFGDLSRLWAGLPALEHLSLRSGAGGVLGRVEHPRLKSFVRVSTGLSASELRSIGAARWPALERLELWTGSTALGAEVTAEALRPLVEGQALPRLTHLGLVACEEARELVPMLLGSPLLPRLRTLDLSRGLVADAEAGLLLRHADRLRHLERLDLSENLLSPAGRDALARALPNARLDGQRTDEGRIVASLDES